MSWPKTVTKDDLEITFIRGTGKGGQKRNKTSTKVRIKHIPTGIVVECDETRKQSKNKQIAFRKLAEKLKPLMVGDSVTTRYQVPSTVVRTYHERDNRVVDARCPGEQWQYDDIIDGDDLDDVIVKVRHNQTIKDGGA